MRASKSSTLGAWGNMNISSHFLEILKTHSFQRNSWKSTLGLLASESWLPYPQSPAITMVTSVILVSNPFLLNSQRGSCFLNWNLPIQENITSLKWPKSNWEIKRKKETNYNQKPPLDISSDETIDQGILLYNSPPQGLLVWEIEGLLLSSFIVRNYSKTFFWLCIFWWEKEEK